MINHSSPLLRTTNNILVDVKFNEVIELVTYNEKLSGLLCKTIKKYLPTTKSSTLELPLMTSTGMMSYMDQDLPY